MAKYGLVENPARKRRRRRRNSATSTTKRVARRNGTTKAGAMSYAKKNGLVLRKAGTPARATANPKRKRRRSRRNGITRTSRNGILGNTKRDAQQVGSLLAGMAVTKVGGRVVSGFLGGILASVGAGSYVDIVADAAVALLVAPMVGGFIDKSSGKQNARLGGLAVVGLDLLNKFAPSLSSTFNPFASGSPIVMTNGGPAVAPAAVAQIVANSGAPQAAVDKVAGAMAALQNNSRMSRPRTINMMPLYD